MNEWNRHQYCVNTRKGKTDRTLWSITCRGYPADQRIGASVRSCS